MNTSLCVDLLLYGGMLLGLSIVAHHLSPHCAATTLWVGIAGGVLSAILGVLGLRGYPLRRCAIGAMTILSLVLLVQAVSAWLAIREDVEGVKAASLIPTLLWAFAVGQLVNLIQNRNGLLLCSLWSQAQPVTDAPAPLDSKTVATVHAPPTVWLAFGLDRLAPLRYAPYADIPLWHYFGKPRRSSSRMRWSSTSTANPTNVMLSPAR